jgi:hypothetical protein
VTLRQPKVHAQGNVHTQQAHTELVHTGLGRAAVWIFSASEHLDPVADARTLERLGRLLRRTSAGDLKLLLFMGQKMA